MPIALKGFHALVLCAGLATGVQAATSPPVVTPHVTATLVSDADAFIAGQDLHLALVFEIAKGWHTYWRNPGTTGQATRLHWKAPAGFEVGDIQWPAPHRFEVSGIANYGYAGHVVHGVDARAPSDLSNAHIVFIEAHATWLACADQCVPEAGAFRLELPVGHVATDAVVSALLAKARATLPKPALGAVELQSTGGHVALQFNPGWAPAWQVGQRFEYFPAAGGIVANSQPPRQGPGSSWSMELAGEDLAHGLRTPDGVLESFAADGSLVASWQVGGPVSVETHVVAPEAALVPAALAEGSSYLMLLCLAVLGGLVLNLMPCVFPVLSIKAMGLVQQAAVNPGRIRAKGLAYTAGVVGSMLILGILLLVLRAGGQQLGWGFQLQSPVFVLLMTYLLFLVGLSLSGLFEVGASLSGAGDSLTRGEGYAASFFTGMLTTVVATPCTAPFMAAAVGAAIALPRYQALGLFAALGVGLALPFVLLSYAPWLRRLLPRPGAWMDLCKQLFAFPMYGSAAWLVWVLAQQTDASGLASVLAGLVLVAFSAWLFQHSRHRRGPGAWVAFGAAACVAGMALAWPIRAVGDHDSVPHGAASDVTGGEWKPYDEATLAAAVAAGRPVLVDFTAAWCLTCLVNERNVFSDASIKSLFRERDVLLLRADWTNRDPRITAALARLGRAGVPAYAVYGGPKQGNAPEMLPQVLTASTVREALAGRAARGLTPGT